MSLFLELILPFLVAFFPFLVPFLDRVVEYLVPTGSLCKISDDVDNIMLSVEDHDDCR